MKRKLLKQVEMKKATKRYRELIKKDDKILYILNSEIKIINGEKILILNFYKSDMLIRDFMKPTIRLFVNKDDYITQVYNDDEYKWSAASLYRIDYKISSSNIKIMNKKSLKNIARYLKKYLNDGSIEKDIISSVFKFQSSIMEKRRNLKHQDEINEIDTEMNKFGKLPKDFLKWLEKDAFYDSSYIFYKYVPKKKLLDGYCSWCKKDVQVEKPRHNKEGICPNCKHQVIYKAKGKVKHLMDYKWVEVFSKSKYNEILSRVFQVYKRYNPNYKKSEFVLYEVKRGVYNNFKCNWYEYANFKQTGNIRWCHDSGKINWHNTVLYEKNLDKVLKGTRYEYSALKEFCTRKKAYEFDSYRYLTAYGKYNWIEHLTKNKLYSLIDSFLFYPYELPKLLNSNKTSLVDILGVNKSDLKFFKEINISVEGLKKYKDLKSIGIIPSEEELNYLIKNNINTNELNNALKYCSFKKALNYIESQKLNFYGSYAVNMWSDYISFCNMLKLDLKKDFILFPRDLKKKHDEYNDIIIQNRNKYYDKAIHELYDEVSKKYSFEYKGYKIVVPTSADDILKEGEKLHHCVGSYISKVAKRKCDILFIRKLDDINNSYFTMEVRENKIIQCKGLNNNDYKNDEDIKSFVDTFKEIILDKTDYRITA